MSENAVDLAFVIEGSRNISPKQFEQFKNFIKSSIDNFPISESASHVAVVEYSDDPMVKIALNDYTSPERLKEVVDRIHPSRGQGVVTDRALRFVASDVYTPERGSRAGVPKVVVVLTGSKSTGRESLRDAAKPLLDRGTKVIVIYSGKTENPELKNITTEGEDGVVTVSEKDQLSVLGGNIAKEIVSAVEKGNIFFQACPVWIYTQSNITQASYSPEYIAPTQQISR